MQVYHYLDLDPPDRPLSCTMTWTYIYCVILLCFNFLDLQYMCFLEVGPLRKKIDPIIRGNRTYPKLGTCFSAHGHWKSFAIMSLSRMIRHIAKLPRIYHAQIEKESKITVKIIFSHHRVYMYAFFVSIVL